MIQSGSNAHQVGVTAFDHDEHVTRAPSRRTRFDVRTTATRDVMVVAAVGDLDALNVPRFRKAITEALGTQATALIVDLSDLGFLSSDGLAALQDAHQSAGRTKQLCVVAAGSATSRPLRMIGLDRKVRVFPTVGEALHDIVSSGPGSAHHEDDVHPLSASPPSRAMPTHFTHHQVNEIVANRAAVEQAKGILMSVYGIDAYLAFNQLRAQARTTRVDLRHFAEQLVNDFSTLTADERRDMPSACTALLLTVHTRVDAGAGPVS